MTRALSAALVLFISGSGISAQEFQLAMPADCEIGKSCFIQQYADIIPGPGAMDYRCGPQTYDGHKGTDIRLRTTADAEKGVNVLAAADGVVARLRNDMVDRLVTTPPGKQAVKGRECGNGIIIDHAGGWQTQYCHLHQASIRVAPGQPVKAGDVLGSIGYSGAAAFAHVHLTVRWNGTLIDPFLGPEGNRDGCKPSARALWSPDIREKLAYRRGEILDIGFATSRPDLHHLETGKLTGETAIGQAPALIAWGWAINLEKADRVVVALQGPDGIVSRTSKVLERHKAQYFLFAGGKRPANGWPAGRYVAQFTILRDGVAALRASRTLTRP